MNEKDQPHIDKGKRTHDKPLSLYPLTMDEALRKALETPPPKDDDKRQQHNKNHKDK